MNSIVSCSGTLFHRPPMPHVPYRAWIHIVAFAKMPLFASRFVPSSASFGKLHVEAPSSSLANPPRKKKATTASLLLLYALDFIINRYRQVRCIQYLVDIPIIKRSGDLSFHGVYTARIIPCDVNVSLSLWTLSSSTRHGVSREFADGAQRIYLCFARWRKMPRR